MNSPNDQSKTPPAEPTEKRNPSGGESDEAREKALKEKIEKLRKEDPNVYPLF